MDVHQQKDQEYGGVGVLTVARAPEEVCDISAIPPECPAVLIRGAVVNGVKNHDFLGEIIDIGTDGGYLVVLMPNDRLIGFPARRELKPLTPFAQEIIEAAAVWAARAGGRRAR